MDIVDRNDLVRARKLTMQLLRDLGFGRLAQVQVATAVSEIVRNVIMYAEQGTLSARATATGVQIEIWDEGPGIPLNVLQEIEDGTYKSSTGLGKGISGARILMDRFSIMSFAGRTQVLMGKDRA
jgi:serine/threonine-protein kinase RsbT